MATHAHATGGGFHTQACCCRRDARIPYAWHKEDAACMLAGDFQAQGGLCRPIRDGW